MSNIENLPTRKPDEPLLLHSRDKVLDRAAEHITHQIPAGQVAGAAIEELSCASCPSRVLLRTRGGASRTKALR